MSENNQLHVSTNKISLITKKRLPLSPTGDLREYRNKLRRVLKKNLQGATYLNAICTVPESNCNFDVENILFYNVGPGTFPKSLRKIHFKKRIGMTEYNSLEYSTQLINNHKEKIDTFSCEHLPIINSNSKPVDYWIACKKEFKERKSQNLKSYGLDITLDIPNWKGNIVGVMKSLLDGIICSLHHYNYSILSEEVKRLAQQTGKTPECLINLLAKPNILGERNILHKHDDGLSWNPADNDCTEVFITINTDCKKNRLLCSLFK